jgi:outer membrane protein OmpA-like peptidoglycan-associated protein
MRIRKMILAAVPLLFLVIGQVASGQIQVQRSGDNPIYKVTINVVEKTTTAVNYRHRGGSTKIDFRGTPLLPDARGEAQVESKQGTIKIEANFNDLQPATRFGPEFLTYVMWAISPEGRATNLGEVILDGKKSQLNVTSDLQAFGLIVTAEPYFSVTQPSDVVVMENFVRQDTLGVVEQVNAKYELLKRGQYIVNVPPADLKPMALDKKVPLDLYEAENAVRIARWAGADKDAADSFNKAQNLLKQAEGYQARNAGKPVSTVAREAVQTAEDARLIALKRQDDTRLADEREAAADRENRARAAADKAKAEADQAARQRAEAELQQRIESERRAQAEAARVTAQASADRARAERAEADLAAAQAARDTEAARADAASARQAADQAAAKAARDTEAARAETDRARQAADQAEREKQDLRKQLVEQFNKILDTRDNARGLIVNMSDVLFDTGQSTLRSGAREKLAKISGIVLAHPGLKLEVEGHTDSVGTDDYNQILSEKRAASVRDFLVQQGVNSSTITARGFGKSQPIASNDNATGRQQNRRVEMVVSGDIIGEPIGATSRLGSR